MRFDSDIKYIAAKSDRKDNQMWLPFTVHSIDTANITVKLFNRWISDKQREYLEECIFEDGNTDNAMQLCRLISLLHDIGKITPAFQKKITKNIDGHTDKIENCGLDINGTEKNFKHNIAGCAILKEFDFPDEIAIIIGLHHGSANLNTNDEIELNKADYYGKNKTAWKEIRKEWINYSIKETGFSSISELPRPNIKCQMILTGLLIMSDWIASNPKYFPLIDTDILSLTEEELNKRAYTAWETIGIPTFWRGEIPDFEDRFGFEANAVQKEVLQKTGEVRKPGIYIFEAPMGLGKTETALACAEILSEKFGCGGIYFGLPTQATANGIFKRIYNWAQQQKDDENHTIRLAHGMTELNEDYQKIFHGNAADADEDAVIVHEWFEGRKQALLADFVVGTVDQFLLASLKQKHVMLRHLGLSGKVVIIDECHAYDAYMNVYLDRTLRWMGAYGVPVIILSATLPPERRDKLLRSYLNQNKTSDIIDDKDKFAYPVLTWTDGNDIKRAALENDIQKKYIGVNRLDECDICEYLGERLSDGGCAAVIVNKVAYAVKLAKRIKEELDGYMVICFHSRFTATDRAEIEKTLLERTGKESKKEDRDKLIVIGTQVIEQSLDIDFDIMITQLCPMDLLLQRMGRLHRHRRERPEKLERAVISVLVTEENSEKIYSKWILQQSEKYLPEEFVIPECIPELVSKVYEDASGEDEKSEAWKKHKKDISDEEEKAKKFCIRSNMINSKRRKMLDDLLNDDLGNSLKAEASVRDSEETPEVILLMKKEDGSISFLPWRNGGRKLDVTRPLSEDDAINFARERIRLPMFFGGERFEKALAELSDPPLRWSENKMIAGEKILLLDENMEVELIGKKLKYSREYGLEIIYEERE